LGRLLSTGCARSPTCRCSPCCCSPGQRGPCSWCRRRGSSRYSSRCGPCRCGRPRRWHTTAGNVSIREVGEEATRSWKVREGDAAPAQCSTQALWEQRGYVLNVGAKRWLSHINSQRSSLGRSLHVTTCPSPVLTVISPFRRTRTLTLTVLPVEHNKEQ
jgi:hypothetical protein